MGFIIGIIHLSFLLVSTIIYYFCLNVGLIKFEDEDVAAIILLVSTVIPYITCICLLGFLIAKILSKKFLREEKEANFD